MAQIRSAPAFQEYAANMLALTDYRLASLAERGLMHTMRCECWVNGRVPADPGKLARYLGLPADEVVGLLPGAMWMLEVSSCGQWITCPELDAYRMELDARRVRQSEGGKVGAEKAKQKRKAEPPQQVPTKVAHEVPRKGSHMAPTMVLSTGQNSPIQNSQEVLMGEPIDPWVAELELYSNGH